MSFRDGGTASVLRPWNCIQGNFVQGENIDIYFNFIGDTFPSQIEINHDDAKKITEQQIAKRKKYQKTSGENRKKKRVALREAAKTDPQAAAEYEALLQKNRERCRQ